jgi:hypothetical protein
VPECSSKVLSKFQCCLRNNLVVGCLLSLHICRLRIDSGTPSVGECLVRGLKGGAITWIRVIVWNIIFIESWMCPCGYGIIPLLNPIGVKNSPFKSLISIPTPSVSNFPVLRQSFSYRFEWWFLRMALAATANGTWAMVIRIGSSKLRLGSKVRSRISFSSRSAYVY